MHPTIFCKGPNFLEAREYYLLPCTKLALESLMEAKTKWRLEYFINWVQQKRDCKNCWSVI